VEVCVLFVSKNGQFIGFFLFSATTQPFGATVATAQPVVTAAAATTAASRPEDLLITSLTSPRLFPDERDDLILKWNILQVFYGTGKTFCSQGSIHFIKLDNRFIYLFIFRCL